MVLFSISEFAVSTRVLRNSTAAARSNQGSDFVVRHQQIFHFVVFYSGIIGIYPLIIYSYVCRIWEAVVKILNQPCTTLIQIVA